MTQEDKQLLLKDICERLPYEVQCHIKHIYHLSGWIDEGDVILTGFRQNEFTKETEPLFRNPDGNPKIVFPIDSVKPYLRPMSSMTEEEKKELSSRYNFTVRNERIQIRYHSDGYWDDDTECPTEEYLWLFDWLNEHHFDYRGLIPMGLALEAPEEMYKTE